MSQSVDRLSGSFTCRAVLHKTFSSMRKASPSISVAAVPPSGAAEVA